MFKYQEFESRSKARKGQKRPGPAGSSPGPASKKGVNSPLHPQEDNRYLHSNLKFKFKSCGKSINVCEHLLGPAVSIAACRPSASSAPPTRAGSSCSSSSGRDQTRQIYVRPDTQTQSARRYSTDRITSYTLPIIKY